MRTGLKSLLILSLVIISLCLSGCKDDTYVYPSVKLEFMSATTDGNGKITQFLSDDNRIVTVIADRTNTTLKADTVIRIISNYEEKGNNEAEIYALAQVLAPEPVPATDAAFEDGIKTDPLSLLSISKGNEFLNLVLSIKMQSGRHSIHVVEESVEINDGGQTEVRLLLYHNANEDPTSFSRRAYASIPLKKYLQHDNEVVVFFSYYNLDNELTSCQPICF